MPTTKLNLPLIDGTNTADVVRDMNALANAVDNKAGASDGLATLDASGKVPASQLNVSAPPDASTSTKGVVQLSNSTTSTEETKAATPKAVKDAKDGLSAQIGILSGLNTTAKDNLVNAVNELFTFANDGKSKWSSVIGSPLVSTDTFSQMQTKTQTIKNTLATNLTNKGQSSVGTEALTALVNKVTSIQTGLKLTAGENLVGRADTARSVLNTNTKIKEIKSNYTGVVRVRFDLRFTFSGSGRIAYGQVYINGIARGVLRTATSEFATTYTEDFNVNTNDLIQLYIYSNQSGNVAEARNFRISTVELPVTEVLLD